MNKNSYTKIELIAKVYAAIRYIVDFLKKRKQKRIEKEDARRQKKHERTLKKIDRSYREIDRIKEEKRNEKTEDRLNNMF